MKIPDHILHMIGHHDPKVRTQGWAAVIAVAAIVLDDAGFDKIVALAEAAESFDVFKGALQRAEQMVTPPPPFGEVV